MKRLFMGEAYRLTGYGISGRSTLISKVFVEPSTFNFNSEVFMLVCLEWINGISFLTYIFDVLPSEVASSSIISVSTY
ncbi:MAG: hypothetical protein LBJ00_07600 [Planctomycetaceae bacterium]|nr:hypothetical protein [Planctomycetaceae bacterium]